MHVVLLHGALGSGSQFIPLAGLLNHNGYTLHHPDLPWHGQGPALPEVHHIMDFVHWVSVNALPAEPAHVFGHSMGGYIALLLAKFYPEKVLSATTLGTRISWSPERAKKEVAMLDAEQMKKNVPSFFEQLTSLHPQLTQLLSRTGHLLTDLGEKDYLNPTELRSIQVKTQVLCGDRDSMANPFDSMEAAAHIPGSWNGILPNTTHPYGKADLALLRQLLIRFWS